MKTLFLLLPLLLCLEDLPDLKQETLEWKVPKNSVLEYDVFEGKSKKPAETDLFFFTSEFHNKNSNRIAMYRYADLPWHFLFQLPKEGIKRGSRWVHTAHFFHESSFAAGLWSWRGPTTIRPLQGTARYTVKKLKDGIATIEASVLFYEIKRDSANNQMRLKVTKNKIGTLATAAEFDIAKGMVVRGGYNLYLMRGQQRVYEKEEWKVRDKKIKTTQRIELSEIVPLDPKKMEKAIEAGKKRAMTWLKRKQSKGGDFGTDRTLETSQVESNLTGLVVESLISAGMDPEDPVIKKALDSIEGNPGPGTPQSYRNAIVAMIRPWITNWQSIEDIRKTLPTDLPAKTKQAIASATRALLNLQDSDSGAWAPGRKRRTNSPNSVTNYHAIEGLFYAWLAGEKFPDRIRDPLLDWYSKKEVEEDQNVKLEFDFAEGISPIMEDPGTVSPSTWPSAFQSRSSNSPFNTGTSRGTAISVLAALESLALLRAQSNLDPSRKKSVNRMILRGLGWLQYLWTLRTPPPTEASWSMRQMEYLLLLMRVMTAYGIEKIDGSDWFLEGAYLLLRNQFQDGSWDQSGGRDIQDTAAGLLFLSRGALKLSPSR